MKQIWAFLNGNKTIICTIIWLLISKGAIKISPELLSVVEYVLMACTGGALAHHIQKGYFTAKKE